MTVPTPPPASRILPAPLRAVEFFSGVGGWRHALGNRGEVVAAFDIHPGANATYALNHGHAPRARDLASLPLEVLEGVGADLWMMSPPCQPFCRMGNQGDLEDPRSRAFLRLLELLEWAPPRHLLLENVVGFLGSQAHRRLGAVLDRLGFRRREWTLCPSAFGLPNLRPRVYLAASRQPLVEREPPCAAPGPLGPYLDGVEAPDLYLTEAELRHKPGLDLVRSGDCRSACFIGGYGQRFLGSGSFLVTDRGIRRFSPAEIKRLLGYPDTFRFPEGLSRMQQYKLLGNGLSLPVAEWVVGALATGEVPLEGA